MKSEDDTNSIQDTSFVAKEFYVEPPTAGSSADTWRKWLKDDHSQRKAARARFTRSLSQASAPINEDTIGAYKQNGVYRQGAALGFQGSAEDNSLTLEASVEASQEYHIALVNMESTRHRRGGTRKGKTSRRRKNRSNK